tara:strand:+ start:4979 stop:6049 length:1071 start_codon:yes stop_codon:yes gene_type:complete
MVDSSYIQAGKAAVLVDGQFGSTGKGLLAAYLAHQPENEVDIAVTNASANAGHWTKYENKDGFCCFHMPTFGVIQDKSTIYLDAGAIIHPDTLMEEMSTLNIPEHRVHIHPNATIIRDVDKQQEHDLNSGATSIASTQKGVGEALMNKIGRKELNIASNCEQIFHMVNTIDLNEELQQGAKVSVEVPQGYSLSINSEFYPHTTSRQCTVTQGLSDANIHPFFLGSIAQSMRTFPIRVGHIYNDAGEIIGHSGNFYADQREINWSDLGVDAELTTVTGRERRVFTWSWLQYERSIIDNRPTHLFINFLNYMHEDAAAINLINEINERYEKIMGNKPSMIYGRGPNVEDVSTSMYLEG